MKKNKEYPATHSMDTAWFAADADGNVAIFQFEENGPGPIPFTDVHTDELLTFLGIDDSEIPVMPFSQEQIDVLVKGLKPVSSFEEITHNCNLLIDPSHLYDILAYDPVFDLCFSKELGFYHLDFWNVESPSAIEEFIRNGYILAAQECDIEIYFDDHRKDQSRHRLADFPFFVYEQSYSQSEAPKRKVTPVHPMKVEQMPDEAKKYMLRLPVHFAQDEQVEPAEFIDSQCWSFCNPVIKKNGITYMELQMTDGTTAYVKVDNHSYETERNKEWKNAPRILKDDTNEE